MINNNNETEKVDPPSLTDKQIFIEEKIDKYAITNLPYEIIEMILPYAVNSSKNSTEPCAMLSQTCLRFNKIKEKKRYTSLVYFHEISRQLFWQLTSFLR